MTNMQRVAAALSQCRHKEQVKAALETMIPENAEAADLQQFRTLWATADSERRNGTDQIFLWRLNAFRGRRPRNATGGVVTVPFGRAGKGRGAGYTDCALCGDC